MWRNRRIDIILLKIDCLVDDDVLGSDVECHCNSPWFQCGRRVISPNAGNRPHGRAFRRQSRRCAPSLKETGVVD
jgi:hypothetical protein